MAKAQEVARECGEIAQPDDDVETGLDGAEIKRVSAGEQRSMGMSGGGRENPVSGTYFGLQKQRRKRAREIRGMGSDPNDYTKKYPRDAVGDEMSPNGRFWRTYLDEAYIFDGERLDGYQDTIDILLIFAGLFSAVLTTFLVQTSQNLQPDYNCISASLLMEIVGYQRSASNVSSIPLSSFYPDMSFSPSLSDIWVNGLWFTSLTLSLITALATVLVKQWLNQYISIISDSSPRERGRIRHYRFMGLEKWHVPMIIGLLPVLLHMSLGLFFAGLCIYLFSLRVVIAYTVSLISGSAYIAYLICHILPLVYPNCPYKTPMTSYAYRLYLSVHDKASSLTRHADDKPSVPPSMREAEQEDARKSEETIDAEAVLWLNSTSSNTSVKQVVLQTVLGIHNGRLPDISGAVGEIFDQVSSLEPEIQYSIMNLQLCPRSIIPKSPSALPSSLFRDTTSSLLAVLQSSLRDSVVLPENVWVRILDCADWKSPSALRLAVELIKVWQDSLPTECEFPSTKHLATELMTIWPRMLSVHQHSSMRQLVLGLVRALTHGNSAVTNDASIHSSCSSTISYFLSSMRTELSGCLIGWLCLMSRSLASQGLGPETPLDGDRNAVFSCLIRACCAELGRDNSTRDIAILLEGTTIAIEMLTLEPRRLLRLSNWEREARRDVCAISSSRIFPKTSSTRERMALLQVLVFHDGISTSAEGTLPSAEVFYGNAIHCLLSPCSLDDCSPDLRVEYWELEWRLLRTVVAPFLALSDDEFVLRIFEEEGGLLALYTRFRDAPSCGPGKSRKIPNGLARHLVNKMISMDTFDPLHFPGPSTSPSFVDNLLLLTRILLCQMPWHRFTQLLRKLTARKDIPKFIWEEYLTELCAWTFHEEFQHQWDSRHRLYAIDYIYQIPAFLPVDADFLWTLPEYDYVTGGENLDVLKEDALLRQYLIIEGDYTFAPLAIPYEKLYHGVTEAYSDDSMDAAAGDRVNNTSHDTTDTSGRDFSSEPI